MPGSDPVTREDVIYAFRFYLFRDPENEEVIDHHIKHCPTFDLLRAGMVNSPAHRGLVPWYRYPGKSFARPAFLDEQSAGIAYEIGEPTFEDPVSQLCTMGQFIDPNYERLKLKRKGPPHIHRKGWEWSYVLRVLERHGMLAPGRRGVGFAVGAEPLPAVMANEGCEIVATDAPEAVADRGGWIATSQYVGELDKLNADGICDVDAFRQRVTFRAVDMNQIPDDLGQFDFAWSSCSLEHLGSLEHGMRFLERTLDLLRPGGVSVHTTEFNLSSPDLTVLNPNGVFYRKRDIEELYLRLKQAGHHVLPLNLQTGTAPEDLHVDLPPYPTDPAHLKFLWQDTDMSVVGTSIGIVVRKGLAGRA